MTSIVLPVGEYIRGDTLPAFCVDVIPHVPGLSVSSARMHFKPTVQGSPVLTYDSTGDAPNVSIEARALGGQTLIFSQTDAPGFECGQYLADLEVIFSNNFRKTLFRATLDVKEDVTR